MEQLKAIVLLFTGILHASHGYHYNYRSEYENTGDEELRLEFPQTWILKCDDPSFRERGVDMNLTVKNELPSPEDTLNIISLSLKNRSLTEIPEQISKSDLLECLDLSENEFPPTKLWPFHHNQRLTSLFLNDQTPQTATEGIFPLFNVSHPDLLYLDMSGTRIHYLANNLRKAFPNLRFLNLSNNNLSSTLLANPPRNLDTLVLKKTDIRIIDFKRHSCTYSLILDNNHYPLLDFKNTTNSSLIVEGIELATHLSLSNCHIRLIRDSCFENALNLKTLDLSFNKLRTLSAEAISIPSLMKLSLSHNHLQDFPSVKNIEELKSLFLSYNEFTVVPRSINDHRFLEVLTLRGNRLEHIKYETFANLEYLKQLDLSENQFIRFGQGWLLHSNYLEYLNLNSNGIKQVEDFNLLGLPLLKQLFIRNNTYKRGYDQIPDDFPEYLEIYVDELNLTDEEKKNVVTMDPDGMRKELHFWENLVRKYNIYD